MGPQNGKVLMLMLVLAVLLLPVQQVWAQNVVLPTENEDVQSADKTDATTTDTAAGAATNTTTQAGTTAAGANNTNDQQVNAGDIGAKISEVVTKIVSIFQKIMEFLGKLFAGIFGTDATAQTPGNTGNTGNTANTGTTGTTGASTDSAALSAYRGGKLSPSEFAKLFGPAARESAKTTGVPASVTLAQAALETGWGGSTIADAKNLFGIKGTGPAGSVNAPTTEYVNGRRVRITARFRKYNSWKESIDDHARLISQVSRYRNCMANKNNPDQFARELQKAGYATDPSYASKLISIMKQHNFYQYDN